MHWFSNCHFGHSNSGIGCKGSLQGQLYSVEVLQQGDMLPGLCFIIRVVWRGALCNNKCINGGVHKE